LLAQSRADAHHKPGHGGGTTTTTTTTTPTTTTTTSPPPPPTGDDAWIPDTTYAIPVGAIFMSPSGDDTAGGTESQPVRTINRAIALCPAGGTIVMRGGIYRDFYNNGTSYQVLTKPLTLQAYPHEKCWADGTDIVSTGWTQDGTRWWVPWQTPTFCGGQYYNADPLVGNGACAPIQHINPSFPAAGDPQMAFIDGVRQVQVGSLVQVAPGKFFYDWTNRRLYIGEDPAGKLIELAKRPAFLVMGNAGNTPVTIRGIGIRRFASSYSKSTRTRAALDIFCYPVLIEKCALLQQATDAVFVQVPVFGGAVRACNIAYNGGNGISANGAVPRSANDDFTIEDCYLTHNNLERFGNDPAFAAEAAMKLTKLVGVTVRRNLVEFTEGTGRGIWLDLGCFDCKIYDNRVRLNGKEGIYDEVCSGTYIVNNVVHDNNGDGISCASIGSQLWHNTSVDNGEQSFVVYDDQRAPSGQDIPGNTANVKFRNNLGALSTGPLFSAPQPGGTHPDTYFTEFDHNAWWRRLAGLHLYQWVSSFYDSSAALATAKGWETAALDITGGSDPFFVNDVGNDLRVRSDSPAYQSGFALPVDIAAVMGVPTGSNQSRGAIGVAHSLVGPII
jgi:parallel beta-helix repeat protein